MSSTTPAGVWIKAHESYASGACVELARWDDGTIALRDSKNPDLQLHYTHHEMSVFFRGVKGGEFDHLVPGSKRRFRVGRRR